jgi:replicative DNA helicase
MLPMTPRTPPQNIEAEQSILGAMLLGGHGAIEEAAALLNPGDFYRTAHGEIFTAMLELHRQGEPVDAITLKNELTRRGVYDLIGGTAYLMTLGDIVPTAANVVYYAKIVQEKAMLRELLAAAGEIVNTVHEEPDDVNAALSAIEQRILAIGNRQAGGEGTSLNDALAESYRALDERHRNRGKLVGIPTGFKDLNYLTSGLRQGDLIVLAARPSMGKTALAGQIAAHAAREGHPAAFFSLEMSAVEIADRLICDEARIDTHRHTNATLTEAEWTVENQARERLWGRNLTFFDDSGLTVSAIRSRCRRLKAKSGLHLVIVDYLQLIGTEQKRPENRVHEVTEIARGLKALARELNCAVVALAQLNRAVERREDKRPELSDLRDSGGIEEAADLVLFLYRPEYYAAEKPPPDQAQPVEVIAAKNRKGPTGNVMLSFTPCYVRFDTPEAST